jgi:hypothetical protein
MKLNTFFLIALMLASITCNRKTRKLSPFENAVRILREVNKNTENFGYALYDRFENKEKNGIPIQDFISHLQKLFGIEKPSLSPFNYAFDLNNDKFISRKEAGLALRNTFVSLASDVIRGVKYSAPEGTQSDKINSLLKYVLNKNKEVREIVDELFDKADKNNNELLSTKDFLQTFKFKPSPNFQNILNTVNPKGEEKINKVQAYKLFLLLAADIEVEEEEGQDMRVLGAEDREIQEKYLLRNKF